MSSKISIVRRKELNEEKYLQLLEETPSATIYNQLFYLDALAENCYFLIVADYQTVLPLPFTKRLYSKCLTNPVFTRCIDRLGQPFENEQEILCLLKKTFDRADINWGNFSFLTEKGNEKKIQWISSCSVEEPNSQAKRNLKKLNKLNYSIETITLDKIIPEMNRLLLFKVGGIRDIELQRFNYLLTHFGSVPLEVKALKLDGEILAMALLCTWKETVYYLKGVTTTQGQPYVAMQTLLFDEIEQAKKEGKNFSFEGSNVPNIMRFNSSFGAENKVYAHYKWDNSSFFFRLIKKMSGK